MLSWLGQGGRGQGGELQWIRPESARETVSGRCKVHVCLCIYVCIYGDNVYECVYMVIVCMCLHVYVSMCVCMYACVCDGRP